MNYEGFFKSFASLIHPPQKFNKWTSNKKKTYSPDYNLLFDIIIIPSETIFVSIDEFVDTCGMPH